jgi:nitrogen fixation NifU-like protein
MDSEVFEFLQRHSTNFINMAFERGRFERLRQPDGYAKCDRECGDSLEMFLLAQNGTIRSASFYTEGCIYTIACANALVHMVEGKSIEQARAISSRHIADYLETLPESEEHCAELAVRTLRAALLDLSNTERQPWAKYYREM